MYLHSTGTSLMFLKGNIIQSVFHMIVECQWSLWSNGACSKSCGVGQRKRTRTKMVAEKFGGACNGQSIKYESCNIQPCPGRYKNFNKHETNQSF